MCSRRKRRQALSFLSLPRGEEQDVARRLGAWRRGAAATTIVLVLRFFSRLDGRVRLCSLAEQAILRAVGARFMPMPLLRERRSARASEIASDGQRLRVLWTDGFSCLAPHHSHPSSPLLPSRMVVICSFSERGRDVRASLHRNLCAALYLRRALDSIPHGGLAKNGLGHLAQGFGFYLALSGQRVS